MGANKEITTGSIFVVAVFRPTFSEKEITLPELRELAKPKEYLNDHGELVETNQPKEGWTLVNGRDYIDTGRILWQRKKESEMNTEKKGRFLHQEWYEAFGRGDDVQFKHSTDNQWRDLRLDFHTLNLFNVPDHKFRLKPRTIQIGSRTINAPISVKPNLNDSFYISSTIHQDKYFKTVWHDSATDNDLLNRQICHLNAVDAINMADAILELMKEAK